MLSNANAWLASCMVSLLMMLLTEPSWADGEQAVQVVADSVSEESYRMYHKAVENMGLGLYGGARYDMGHRSRDGWGGPRFTRQSRNSSVPPRPIRSNGPGRLHTGNLLERGR